MTDFAVRALTDPAEIRAAHSVLAVALHRPPLSDSRWEGVRTTYEPERYFGAVSDAGVIGSTYIFDSSVLVPGGKVVPMAGVSRVGVRADWRRRGVLTELMRFQFADAQARGQIIAGLHASESVIYGRFGYGISAHDRQLNLHNARVRPDLQPYGQIRAVGAQEAVDLLPALYARFGMCRPGMISRGRDWWTSQVTRTMRGDEPYQVYVHSGPDGDDGYVLFQVDGEGQDHTARLRLWDLHGTTPEVRNDLWRFMLGIDLVSEIFCPSRPVDDPVQLLLADPRRCRTASVSDDLWLRLVDVPAALAARTYGDADPVVLSVDDEFLPANSGTYRVSRDGVTRTDETAALSVGVDVLAMMYLGAWKVSDLAAAGRMTVLDGTAPARADRLFSSDQTAWCGTGF